MWSSSKFKKEIQETFGNSENVSWIEEKNGYLKISVETRYNKYSIYADPLNNVLGCSCSSKFDESPYITGLADGKLNSKTFNNILKFIIGMEIQSYQTPMVMGIVYNENQDCFSITKNKESLDKYVGYMNPFRKDRTC